MRNESRFVALAFVVVFAIACGSSSDQSAPASGTAPANEAPAAGAAATPGTDASSPGADMRANAAPGSPASAPSAPAAPRTVAVEVPSGTDLVLTLETPVSSETAKVEQAVRARVAKPVLVNGTTVIPDGATVTGTVVSAERAGRVKGRASLALRFNEVTVEGIDYRIATARIAREAEATKGEDATKIGIATGVGTAIGAIAGGKKGAAIGAGIGGGAGTGAVLATRGKEVELPAGATLRTSFQSPVTITVKGS